ncbi:MAG: hypothetical protein MJY60_05825 [Bacteroidales bacterium]|nr:hypothetical protein [Bacteroidales bacterium]
MSGTLASFRGEAGGMATGGDREYTFERRQAAEGTSCRGAVGGIVVPGDDEGPEVLVPRHAVKGIRIAEFLAQGIAVQAGKGPQAEGHGEAGLKADADIRPDGLNGHILLIHLGTSDLRSDKFYDRLDELIEKLLAKGYSFTALK